MSLEVGVQNAETVERREELGALEAWICDAWGLGCLGLDHEKGEEGVSIATPLTNFVSMPNEGNIQELLNKSDLRPLFRRYTIHFIDISSHC